MGEHLHSDEHMDWSNVFSETQCQLLSIGRALVSNPEVLCIHKPTERFPEHSAMRIWGALSIFVAERGTVQKLPKGTRRPRTCLATVVRGEHYNMADKLYYISAGSFRKVNTDEARRLARNELEASLDSDSADRMLQAEHDIRISERSKNLQPFHRKEGGTLNGSKAPQA